MKALAVVRKGVTSGFELVDVPEPKMGEGEVKIKVEKCAICGSEIREYRQGATPLHHLNIPVKKAPIYIRGHEFTGTISEIGRYVRDFKEGDRVVVDSSIRNACGSCIYCRMGEYCFCPSRWSWKEKISYGGFARYYVIKPDSILKLPEIVDFSSGTLCEPLSVCVRGACQQSKVKAGDFVVISGPGALGLLTLQIVKSQGATAVILGLNRDKHRLEVAKDLGADLTISVEEENAREIVENLTKGKGADVVFECAGSEASIKLCLQLIGWNGQLVQMGVSGTDIRIDYDMIMLKNVRLQGSYGHNWNSWLKAITLLEKGIVKTKPLISEEMAITRWKEAFEKMSRSEGLSILLCPVN